MIQQQTAYATGKDNAGPFLKPGWSPFNIMLMILGFVFFWPLGLAMLCYNIWGHKLSDLIQDIKRQFEDLFDWSTTSRPVRPMGNTAFDTYRAEELARLEQERAKIDAMRQEFDDHLNSLRQARDQEEFDEFMASRTKAAKKR
ncbi:MAG: DUF2852 domain-containing protein [Hyphomicrobiales bacterium]